MSDHPPRHGYHRSPIHGGFDDTGNHVVTVGPKYSSFEEDEFAHSDRPDTQAAIAGFLRLLTTNSSALLAGQRLHLLAFLLKISPHRTQRELAKALNISPGRVSQILRTIPQEFDAIARLNAPRAKRHPHR